MMITTELNLKSLQAETKLRQSLSIDPKLSRGQILAEALNKDSLLIRIEAKRRQKPTHFIEALSTLDVLMKELTAKAPKKQAELTIMPYKTDIFRDGLALLGA